ncbi:unnamed protein product [Schistocephalus solidus]|uniref:Uncharacterized protein n=1 Tax=Schistocephalus solidus TaxID=70667 RepID=A0A183SFJ6_SCHSO|nr:unnamed protein product [Schistocephalus solidus]
MVSPEGHGSVHCPGCPCRACHQHQDWFNDYDAAIMTLLAEKNQLYIAYVDRLVAANKTALYRSCRLVQQRLRETKDAWMARKAEAIQGYADCNKWKNFFAVTKVVCGLTQRGTTPLLIALRRTLQTRPQPPSTISDDTINRLPQVEPNADLDLTPSLQETSRAVQQLPREKAPVSDAISAEIYKHGGPQLMNNLTAPFQETWRPRQDPRI